MTAEEEVGGAATVRPDSLEQDRASRQTQLEAIADIRSMVARIDERGERSNEKLDLVCEEMGDVKTYLTAQNLKFEDLERVKPNGLAGTSVLVVEDSDYMLRQAERALVALGCSPKAVPSRAAAERALVEHGPFDVAVVCLRIPESKDGIELCKWINRFHQKTAVVVMGTRLQTPGLDELRVARLSMPFDFMQLERMLLIATGHEPALRDTERPSRDGFRPEVVTLQSALDDDEPNTDAQTPEALAVVRGG